MTDFATLLGKKVGRIRILEALGRGGMGEVYAGFDDKLRRKVALKAVRQDRFDAEAKARFLREARLLSRLDHPNICRIHELIEGEEGGDYLVLELISGSNLRQALEEGVVEPHKARIAEQLARVLVVAHAEGIIHRDLKPENVMITPQGDVKVLDFGLARSIEAPAKAGGPPAELPAGDHQPRESAGDRRSTEIETRRGRVLGTAASMSPEQARGEGATTASDLYSFGLLLQELYTGRRPYPQNLGFGLLLLKVSRAETVPVTGVDPDLAALIGRLLSLAPAARPTAVDTLERLRWIGGKGRRRRRRRLAAAAIALLALLTAAMVVQTFRAEREAARANREAETARQVSAFLVDLFAVSDPGEARGNTITAREILDRGAVRIHRELGDQPLTRARLMDTIGEVYRQLGLYGAAEPLHEQALESRRRLLGEGHPDVAASLDHLAAVYYFQGRYGAAEPLYRRVVEIREQAFGEDHPAVASALNDLANLYWIEGRYGAAEPLHRRALGIRQRVLGDGEHLDIAESLGSLATLYVDQGRHAEAEPLYRRDLEISEKLLGPDHPSVATTLNNLATLCVDLGRFGEAESLHRRALEIKRRALGAEHPSVAATLSNLGHLYGEQGRLEEAEALFRRAQEVWEKALGPEHHHVARALFRRAEVCRRLGRGAEAEPLYRRALEIGEGALGAKHPSVVEVRQAYAAFVAAR